MDQQILETILKNTYTLSQLKHRLKILRIKLSAAFFGEGQQAQSFSPQDNDWLNSLPKELLTAFNNNNFSRLISDIELSISKIEMLTLYLPFETEDEVLKQIGVKSRELFGQNFLLDIKYNPQLIAGCALSWKGLYKDYSVHAKINERRQLIAQNFKRFIR